MGVFFVIVFVIGVFAYQIKQNLDNDREWHEGLFERNDSYNYDEMADDPLLEAFIGLGALMVRNDTSSYGEKILYLNSYFAKNFPRTHYDFGRSFTESLKNPVKPKVLTKWLRRKLPSRAQRIQVMYFLAGLATVDGSMNKREVDLLREMNLLLELSPADFDSIIAMYTQKRESEQTSEDTRSKVSAIQLACKIIGVSEHASLDEIKKAYRGLVKLHHPDRFATDSMEQQLLAAERFKEIQKAYEVLERR
jgi:DnaJ like chaperone protein